MPWAQKRGARGAEGKQSWGLATEAHATALCMQIISLPMVSEDVATSHRLETAYRASCGAKWRVVLAPSSGASRKGPAGSSPKTPRQPFSLSLLGTPNMTCWVRGVHIISYQPDSSVIGDLPRAGVQLSPIRFPRVCSSTIAA
jgi:hypothetical protein